MHVISSRVASCDLIPAVGVLVTKFTQALKRNKLTAPSIRMFQSLCVCLFSDHTLFIVKDAENEKKFGFKLLTSLQKADAHKLFTDYKIHVTKNVKPDPSSMKRKNESRNPI